MIVCVQVGYSEEEFWLIHYDDVIMTMLASQITSLTVVYSIVYSGVNQRKHQSSASLAFVREIHRGPVNFPHKWPVTRKMFPFDDVIMLLPYCYPQITFHLSRTLYRTISNLSNCHFDDLPKHIAQNYTRFQQRTKHVYDIWTYCTSAFHFPFHMIPWV